MGKQIREKKHAMSVENSSTGTSTSTSTSHQGRAWNILNIIKYHRWHHNVKKRFAHRKHGGGKSPAPVDIPAEVDNMQDYEPKSKLSSVEETAVQSTLPAKQSVKARLRALITEEIARKKGQHKRSSTYPVKPQQPNQADPIPSLDHSDLDHVTESLLTEKNSNMVPENTGTLDELPPICSTTNKEICVECGTMFSNDFMEQNSQVHKHHKQSSEYHQAFMKETLSCEEKSMHAKLLTTDVSPYLFKDFLDALDIINANKDLLLKFLQHQSSPLAYHFHNQQALAGKMRLNKSISFPVPGSSSSQIKGQNTNRMTDELFKSRKVQNDSQLQSAISQFESSEKFYPQPLSLDSSYSLVPSQDQNHRVIKHFKDLRQKAKHVIEESKNEKRRITMDAILHKIPHGNKLSKELKRKILEQPKDPSIHREGIDIASTSECDSFNKHQVSPMRTSSLNESVGRYSQLYETCFNKEAKYPRSERLKLKAEERNSILRTPKSFQRFLSLPNLKDYFSQIEEPSAFLPPQIPIRKFGEKTTSLSTSVDNITTPESVSKSVQKEIVIRNDTGFGSDEDKGESNQKESIGIDDDFGKLTDSDINESTSVAAEAKSISFSDSSFPDDSIDFDGKLSLPEDSKIKPGPMDGLDHLAKQLQETNIADYHEVARREDDFQKKKHLNLEIPGLEVDANSEAEFNYVRDVLELSGLFTGRESFGICYSNDQPVDPTVYEELEGCLLFDPKCAGNTCNEEEGGGHCNHLILFDLINEVLIEIFGRSYSYYPKSLSSLSYVHPIPIGYQVLREVWTLIRWYLSLNSEFYSSLDYHVSRDLARSDGWMNLQFDSECVGLELDDLIFDDLLEEIICN